MSAMTMPKPFVGRERELDRLQVAFIAADSGEGGMVLTAGEPGIGKTTLCRQFAAWVVARGGRALTGHCEDEETLSLPYLPFIEALRGAVAGQGEAALRAALGPAAADLARIVPELRSPSANGRPSGPAADPVEARYLLHQAVTSFLRTMARMAPILLVLEDLQDADRGTLDLLAHLSRDLSEVRLLVVGTYRNTEVDVGHPLAETITMVRRRGSVDRVNLGGLAPAEVGDLIGRIADRPVSAELAAAVYEHTEGNPLFVWEVMRQQLEGDQFSLESPRKRTGSIWTEPVPMPDGLREVIGTRLSRLGQPCRRVLAVAAVIGREFSHRTIQALTGDADETVTTALAAAVRAAVLQEEVRVGEVRYRFAHALFRRALYDDLPATERLRLHPHAARVLEVQYGPRRDDHAAELAEHLARSAVPADLHAAIGYFRRAASHAVSVYAPGEAARLLRQALAVQDVVASDDQPLRCDLLTEAGQALIDAGEARCVLDAVAPEAFALADGLGDAARASAACQLAMAALNTNGSSPGLSTPEAAHWAERADRYARPGTVARVWADGFLGAVGYMRDPWYHGVSYLSRALALARRLDDPEARWWAAFLWLWYGQAPQYADEQLRLAKEVTGWPRTGVSTRARAMALTWAGDSFLNRGQRARAEAVWQELQQIAARSGQPIIRLNALRCAATLATLDGRLEEAIAIGDDLRALGEDSGLREYAHIVTSLTSQRALLYLGRADAALALAYSDMTRTLPLAHLDSTAEARAHLARFVTSRPSFDDVPDDTPAFADVYRLEAAVIVGDQAATARLVERLTPCRHVTTGTRVSTCIARHLGAADALLGKPTEARAQYGAALELTTAIRFRPEAALTRIGLAELLLTTAPGEHAAAAQQLSLAIDELEAMNMRPALARARRLAAQAMQRDTRPSCIDSGAQRLDLTARELEILRLVAAGRSNAEIASILVISLNTVYRHIHHIFTKLGVSNRTEAAAHAYRRGLA